MSFLSNRYARVLTAFLCLQLFAFYALASRPEKTPMVGPLADFPNALDGWMGTRDYPIEQDTLDVLRADDTLDRLYVDTRVKRSVILFMAFFNTQRYGQSPHSPKNCLPGSGWEPVAGMSSRPALTEPGEAQPIVINKYVTEHGDETKRNAVLVPDAWPHHRERIRRQVLVDRRFHPLSPKRYSHREGDHTGE